MTPSQKASTSPFVHCCIEAHMASSRFPYFGEGMASSCNTGSIPKQPMTAFCFLQLSERSALRKGFRGLRKYFWPGVAFRAARTSECVSEARPAAAESCLNTPLGTAGPVSMTTLLTEAAPQELAPEPASQPLPSPIPEASETGLPPFKTFLIPRAPRPIPCSELESWACLGLNLFSDSLVGIWLLRSPPSEVPLP